MAGVHRLKHVEGFSGPHLADHDPVGAHTQRILHEMALGNLAGALDVRRPGFKPHHVRLLQLKLGGVLDRHDPLVIADKTRDRVEECRLAAARAARNQHIELCVNDRLHEIADLRRDRAEFDQCVDVRTDRGELTNRHDGAVDRKRRYDHVHARTVLEPGVAHRLGFIDAPADRRNDLVDDAQQVALILELDGRDLEPPVALDIHGRGRVDQDVRDRRILDQRLDRPKAQDLVEDIRDDLGLLRRRQGDRLTREQLLDHLADFAADFLRLHLVENRKVHHFQQFLVQPDLEIRLARRGLARDSRHVGEVAFRHP